MHSLSVLLKVIVLKLNFFIVLLDNLEQILFNTDFLFQPTLNAPIRASSNVSRISASSKVGFAMAILIAAHKTTKMRNCVEVR